MKVLITGGAGFIGSHLANKLYNEGHDVVVFDMLGKTSCLERLTSNNIPIIQDKIQNPEVWKNIDKDFDLVINSAAETHVDHSFIRPQEFIKTNILGLHYVSKFCADHKISLLHLSTDEVIGTGEPLYENSMALPTNPYAATKASGEAMLHAYGYCYQLDWKVVRLNNTYGTMQFPDKLIPFFIRRLYSNQKLTIHGTGEQIRFFLHIKDFIDAVMLVLEKGKSCNIYNVSTNESYTILEVSKMICDAMSKDFDTSIQFVKDRLFQDLTYLSNSDKLRSLGWKPKRTLKETLPELINWYIKNTNFFLTDKFVSYF